MQSVPVDNQKSPGEPGKHREETIAKRAVVGAVWTISTSLGSRIVGTVGTFLVLRFISPEAYGDFSQASVVVLTAFVISNCGLSQYIVSKPKEGREAAFHATFYFMLLGAIAIGGVVLLEGPIGDLIHTPGIVEYVPGLALTAMFERFATVQDRILVRDMRFQAVGLLRSLGDVIFAVLSVALAWAGWGGAALVWASIARAGVRMVALFFVTPLKEWLSPCRITWQRTRDIFGFGLPMSVATLAGFGSRRWDNILIGRHFGSRVVGFYNVAYNLADVPATQIGETIGDVLVPSFAQMDSNEQRKRALLISMRFLILIVAPLAIGLGVIAPTLVEATFKPEWKPVAPMLIVLSVLSVVRPIGWIGSSYLQVRNKPRAIMVLEVTKTISLLALIVIFQNLYRIANVVGMPWLTPLFMLKSYAWLYACGAVGVAFAANSLGFMWVIKRVDNLSLRTQILPLLPPILACIPMVVAIVAVRHGLLAYSLAKSIRLCIELLVGAIVFVPSALLIAPATSRDLLGLLREALLRRRRRNSMAPPPDAGEVAGPPSG